MAMNEEMESLQKNQTWDLVELPKGRRITRCKWIFKKKFGLSTEEVICYKAHLVAKGYGQKEGVDYNEAFSPVVRHISINVLLSLVATLYMMELEQLDVKTAFLHRILDECILMQQLVGFKVKGKENFVSILKRPFYGLKLSPRQWYKRFDEFIVSHRCTRSPYDSCVYHSKVEDDMFIASQNLLAIQKLKSLLNGKFEMKDMGTAEKILGIKIKRD